MARRSLALLVFGLTFIVTAVGRAQVVAPTASPAPSAQAVAIPEVVTGLPLTETASAAETSATIRRDPSAGAPAEQLGFLEFVDPDGVPLALLVIAIAWITLKASERLAGSLAERVVAKRLVIKQAHTLIVFAVYVVATAMAASAVLELPAQALFTLSGTLAVTLGFAFKDVAASFLAGISILINKPFQVGDRITFGEHYGEVQEIGLRTVRLVTLDDNLVTIPSNKFLTDAVASANAGQLDCMVVMTYWTTASGDYARAKQVIHDAVMASKYLYLGKPFDVLVSARMSAAGRVAIEYTAKAYVYDARHEKALASDVTERVLAAFRKEGIEIPG